MGFPKKQERKKIMDETQYKIKKMIEVLERMEEIDNTFYIPVCKKIEPFLEARGNLLLKSFETPYIGYREKQYEILEQKKIHFTYLYEKRRVWNSWNESEVIKIENQCKNWYSLDRKSIQRIVKFLKEFRKSY